MKRSLILCAIFSSLVPFTLRAADHISVTNAGPAGEISSLAQANEIRVTFSEPMITIGRAPANPKPSFFHITPAVEGTFWWSGTTTLIFAPDPKQPLPFATSFSIVIDTTAASVDGKTLENPYRFEFITPTIRLQSTDWYRKKENGAIVISLRFNQPVTASDLGDHIHLQEQDHPDETPELTDDQKTLLQTRMPGSVPLFDAKAATAKTRAASTAPVLGFFPTTWDKKRFSPDNRMVVFETQPGIPTGVWISVKLDEGAHGVEGRATPGTTQQYIIKVEPMLFIKGLECSEACSPDSYNPIRFTTPIKVESARSAITVFDVTDRAHQKALPRDANVKKADDETDGYETSRDITFEDLGYHHTPGHRYVIQVGRTLEALDGEQLGFDWAGELEDWHQLAFTSFGEGHGVWESSGGTVLPLYVRNLKSLDEWIAPLAKNDLMPTILKLEKADFALAPDGQPKNVKLSLLVDKIQSIGIEAASALHSGTGLAWITVKPGEAIPRSHQDERRPLEGSVVQVTNLGITVKDSPQNTLVMVTKLDDGSPVPGAAVEIRTLENEVSWKGTTGPDGIAIAPDTAALRTQPGQVPASVDEDPDIAQDMWSLKFIVTAEKNGDVAYAESNWNEGILPWDFGVGLDLNLSESVPLIRGSVFADRGVYKPGEDVHLKAILRSDTPAGVRLLASGTPATVVIKDSRDKEVDRTTVKLSEWSSADLTFHVPDDADFGGYTVTARAPKQRGTATGTFLVAAYRRPDFRVDATLGPASSVAGTTLKGVVTGRYLFGAAMSGRDVHWTYSKERVNDVPAAIEDRFPPERFTFLGFDPSVDEQESSKETISTDEAKLAAKGEISLDLETDLKAGVPLSYTIEGEVQDISRQKIAGRASTIVAAAPWYIGLTTPPFFVEQDKGLDTEVVAAGLDGKPVAGVKVDVRLMQIQWNSVRRAEGNGFYTWDTERKVAEMGKWTVTSEDKPVSLHVPFDNGGEFYLKASASDADGRTTTTYDEFYVLGSGYTAWARYDNNRINLVPEKKTYRPGETARIMIQSPWETATALLTTEREGVRTHREFQLKSTQQTVEIPIAESDIPNIYVSVLLVKGRTSTKLDKDGSDPGKPAFRLGYTELKVEDDSKKLKVDVKANRDEYRPAAKAKVSVDVTDPTKAPVRSEVTLWAVDYGVLSLTGYHTPDVIDSVYIKKALEVLTEDSRQKIISRRVVIPKGGDAGGGGGGDAGPGTVRKDFRVLAFWLGSVVTDKKGHANVEVTLPESLTTYRIMAVAADKESRFGWGEREIRTSKPVLLQPAYPRFLALGDKALFGAVVQNQLKKGGKAEVTVRSLDPAVLQITGATTQSIDVAAGSSAEARFAASANNVGQARVQMTVKLQGETDSFQDVVPVRILAVPEVVASYGVAKPDASEKLEIPAGVLPGVGGLHVDLSSTAMVGLGEGARYLIDYPYGCAEQRSSRTLALLLTADLADAFKLPGIDPSNLKSVVQTNVDILATFQCPEGSYSLWAGDCKAANPFLTSYVVHVLQRAAALGYTVDKAGLDRSYAYLESSLSSAGEPNEGWWPAYTSWQSFAVRVLTEGGRNEDSHVTRLYGYRDRMPLFAVAYLLDAMHAHGEVSGERVTDLRRRLMNAILPEAGNSHVEELHDPYLLWYWNSNVRTTAIVLRSLVTDGGDETIIQQMVRWLLAVRKDGRWSNTQENGLALEALVDYYRKYESEPPSFTASVALGGQPLMTAKFEGRSTTSVTKDVPMQTLVASPTKTEDLTFHREGTGTLHYMTQLKYVANEMFEAGLDHGFRVERSYYVVDRGAVDSSDDSGKPATTFNAGDLVRVVLRFALTKERRFVAVTDPLPAGLEPVESWFATTASDLVKAQEDSQTESDWTTWWEHGGFDHIERHDDRVLAFATRLSEGNFKFSYLARATTSGTFLTAPTHVEEMYEPEVFGRTKSNTIEVKP